MLVVLSNVLTRVSKPEYFTTAFPVLLKKIGIQTLIPKLNSNKGILQIYI